MAYILIVDDDVDLANAEAVFLRSEGYEVEIITDPTMAIQSIEKRRPDCILLDVMFPENASGGFDLARLIASKFVRSKPIPVLMLTAVNDRFSLGFTNKDIDPEWFPIMEFMDKPMEFSVLKSTVALLLEQAAKVREPKEK
jgi:CheY-like chemotaxis protein